MMSPTTSLHVSGHTWVGDQHYSRHNHTETQAVVPELVDVAVPDAVALLVSEDVDVPDDVLVAVEVDEPVSELVEVPVAV